MFSAVHPTTDIAKILRHVRFVQRREVGCAHAATLTPPSFDARRPVLLSQTACSKTPVSHSGSLIITEWPDVVFSRTVQDLSALHSANALSNAAIGNLGKRM